MESRSRGYERCVGRAAGDDGPACHQEASRATLPRMKIYTRTGDDGTTGVLGPGRVPKHAPRVEAYGAVDELNAVLGVARGLDRERWLDPELGAIQEKLFPLGAELSAVEPSRLQGLERIADE